MFYDFRGVAVGCFAAIVWKSPVLRRLTKDGKDRNRENHRRTIIADCAKALISVRLTEMPSAPFGLGQHGLLRFVVIRVNAVIWLDRY